MADTILILGNGFDLSMGRKTSYSDFVEFANNLFLEKKPICSHFLTVIILILKNIKIIYTLGL